MSAAVHDAGVRQVAEHLALAAGDALTVSSDDAADLAFAGRVAAFVGATLTRASMEPVPNDNPAPLGPAIIRTGDIVHAVGRSGAVRRLWGLAEIGAVVAIADVTRESPWGLPLGELVTGLGVSVLDEVGEPLPPGVAGRLALHGIRAGAEVTPWILPGVQARRSARGEVVLVGPDRIPAAPSVARPPAPAGPVPTAVSAECSLSGPAADAVADAWGTVLGVRPREVDDDFFALGGQSVLVLTLAAELEARLGVAPEAAQLLATPTFAGQVRLVAGRLDQLAGVDGPAGQDAGMPAPCHAQLAAWLAAHDRPRDPEHVVAVLLEPLGQLTLIDVEAALEQLTTRHEALHLAVRLGDDGAPRLVPARLPVVVVEARDPDAARARLASALDPDTGPLAGVALIERDGSGPRLVLAGHRVALDDRALGVLGAELLAELASGRDGPVQPGSSVAGLIDVCRWESGEDGRRAVAADREHWLHRPITPEKEAGPPARSSIQQEPGIRAAAALVSLAVTLDPQAGRRECIVGLDLPGVPDHLREALGPFTNRLPLLLRWTPDTPVDRLVAAAGADWAWAHRHRLARRELLGDWGALLPELVVSLVDGPPRAGVPLTPQPVVVPTAELGDPEATESGAPRVRVMAGPAGWLARVALITRLTAVDPAATVGSVQAALRAADSARQAAVGTGPARARPVGSGRAT